MAAVTVYDFVHGGPPTKYLVPMAILALLGLGSLVIAVVLNRRAKQQESLIQRAVADAAETRARLENSTKELNQILAVDYVHCMYVAGLGCDPRKRDEAFIQEARNRLNTYIVEMLGHAASLFTSYTGAKCAASLKILSSERHERGTAKQAVDAEDPPRFVYTYARDPQSRVRRSATDGLPRLGIYEWTDHAAFGEVMNGSEQHGYFFSNDLKALGPKYWNANPRWKEFYNAIAVCALKNPANEDVVEAMGFLCIDNSDGGFDAGACRELLECIASVIYYTFRTTEEAINTRVEVQGNG